MFSTTSSQREETWSQEWKEICDKIAKSGPAGSFVANHILRRITINAPVVLLFVAICVVLHIMTGWFPGMFRILGVLDTWDGSRLLQYTSLFTHIFAHSDYNHLKGNMTHLLLTGPGVEYAFGSKNLAIIMLVVALVSAFAHIMFGSSYTHQLGASGVVFACILLNSLVSASNGKIPLSFILTATLYLGDEFFKFFWGGGAVSHHAHLTGGLVGAAAGFVIQKQRTKKKTKSIIEKWMKGKNKKKS
jgi:membrane associated rhomboid family serine protease